MSIKIAEQQMRKSRKMTLREFPERDQHIANQEEYVKLVKAGTPPTHEWQRRRLGYVYAGSPDKPAPIAARSPETLAEAKSWDARVARFLSRGFTGIEASRLAWGACR